MVSLQLSRQSLLGLSIGDAFGERFFGEEQEALDRIRQRELPTQPWEFTDDTVMAISVVKVLQTKGEIDQDLLAQLLVQNHDLDPFRGYGATARKILREVGEGRDWRQVSRSAFDGMGSMGNGASMRAAPIGAFFNSASPEQVLEQAKLSAEVTHMHEEGIAGAQAVAIAAWLAVNERHGSTHTSSDQFLASVADFVKGTEVGSRIRRGLQLDPNSSPGILMALLGNGSLIQAQDTVPFGIWCVAHFRHSFEEALWKAVSVLGDRDTICAIVGSIVALSAPETIPQSWLQATEKWEESVFWITAK